MFYVWRVENEYGNGPYETLSTNNKEYFGINWHCSETGQPVPQEEFPYIEYEDCFLYGFKTINQAYNWFSEEELSKLELYGYFLKRIKVFKIVHGNRNSKQIIFIRKEG